MSFHNFKRGWVFAFIGLFSSTISFAQTDESSDDMNVHISIPSVAILDLESSTGTAITLNVEAPTEAGQPLDFSNATDSSIWLNYSSIEGSTTMPFRAVYVRLASGSVPDGLRLYVEALQPVGGAGKLGVANAGRTIIDTDRRIIRRIRSGYTGNGPGSGHQLIYSLSVRNGKYNRIDFDQSTTVTVLYTIAEN